MSGKLANKSVRKIVLWLLLVPAGTFLWLGLLSLPTATAFIPVQKLTKTSSSVKTSKHKRIVGPGTCGLDAFNVRQKLSFLKFLPVSKKECIDQKAYQAIIAFQKWQNLERDGYVGVKTRAKLYSVRSRPKLKKDGRSRRLEINLSKQIMFVVKNDQVKRIISVSTGMPGYSTPTGKYQIFRKEQMSWSVPYSVYMPWSSYFNGGIAIHQGEVPAYPASHGCVRVPQSFAKQVYRFAGYGTQVVVR
jgi:hypothetical protein